MTLIRKLKNIDFTIILIIVCLIALGTMAIYSATSGTRYDGLHINNMNLFAVSCIPLLLFALLDYRLLAGKFSYVIYGVGIAMLVLVLFKGEYANGATRWIALGSLQFQPSEVVKISTILLVAHLLHKRDGEKLRIFRDLIPIAVIVMIPIILIMKQPDLGTSLVFVGILIGMVWMGNIRLSHMILCISVIVGTVTAILWLYYGNPELLSKIVEPHQLARIQTFLDPASDPDKSWHVLNSMRAVGIGQMYGEGFQHGFFIQNGYIPYAYSDSIYVVIGEEFGFLGTSVLLILYFALIYRMIIIAMRSRDLSGSFLVIGFISMLALQVFVNIGMHIGMLPLTGISLPFISYGGSSLLTNMVAIGLVLSVNIHRKVID